MTETNKPQYEDYCRFILQGLCKSSQISIERSLDEMGVLLTVSGISSPDMRFVIGKDGNHVKAIRTLLRAYGLAEHAQISLKILEPDGSERKVGNNTPSHGATA